MTFKEMAEAGYIVSGKFRRDSASTTVVLEFRAPNGDGFGAAFGVSDDEEICERKRAAASGMPAEKIGRWFADTISTRASAALTVLLRRVLS